MPRPDQLSAHAADGRGPAVHECGNGTVVALDATTGKVAWSEASPQNRGRRRVATSYGTMSRTTWCNRGLGPRIGESRARVLD
jgi:outer membrane protein assembly factor BamB